MKKIFLKTFFGFVVMLACFKPAFADPIDDSGNVVYHGGFVPVSSGVQNGTTELSTGIFEYTITFPKTTPMVPYNTKNKVIGPVVVTGEAFMKPYKIAVNIDRKNFKLVTKETRNIYKNDTIEFDVIELVKDKFGNISTGESLLGKTIYYYKDNLEDVVIADDNQKGNMKVEDDGNSGYMNGAVANINQSLDVGIHVAKSEWATASPGKYKGKITFYATVDTSDIWSGS